MLTQVWAFWFRYTVFLCFPIYFLGRVDSYFPLAINLVNILEFILAGLLGLYSGKLLNEAYMRGMYDKDMQYAGTD